MSSSRQKSLRFGVIDRSWATPPTVPVQVPDDGVSSTLIPASPPALGDGRKATRFSITNYLKAKPEDFKQLDEILKLVQEKKFQVVIGKSFPLAETRAAQRYLEGREHFGKVILTM